MKPILKSSLLSLTILASMTATLAGCGATDNTTPIVNTGSVCTDPSCGCTGSGCGITSGCAPITGSNLTLCSEPAGPLFPETSLSGNGAFPRVNPGEIHNAFMGPYVQAGDVLDFIGSGGFGPEGFLGWCDNTGDGDWNMDGVKDGASTVSYLGFNPDDCTPIPEGFVALIGSHYYLLGFHSRTVVATSGYLVAGFNFNADNGCGILGISQFIHSFCVDPSTGARATCPTLD